VREADDGHPLIVPRAGGAIAQHSPRMEDHRSGDVEALPPLHLRELRRLDLAEPPGRVAAASGIVRRGDVVHVIGDDQRYLAEFRLSSPAPGTVRRLLEADGDDKPDLEALTVLPPFADHPYGALLGLGSGSAPARRRGFTCALAADGTLAGEPAELDLAPVYALLAEHVDGLNVEGACVMGERLWLLHRGNRGERTNVVAELSLDALVRSLGGDRRVDVHELAAVREYDLGSLDGVELTFSDATPIGGDLLVFTASAEAQGVDGPDGAIRGSVVGTIDLDGDVRRLRTIDRRYKVEGVHATIDTGVLDFLFVCDQDDPDAAAPLLSAAMPLDGRFER
jgi:hypothetical protein